ncbi:hypothetical protein NVP1101O_186 [Vibrio phage 1.101.O._10N.261.45.C6]|nr:hypothetical protein NVP1101O_186 [Vibrio phage 1.101.O._10N.261.45.C6]
MFFMSCAHKWVVLSEVTTKSKFELLMDEAGTCPTPRNTLQMEELTKRKHISILTCTECGKLKRFVENI